MRSNRVVLATAAVAVCLAVCASQGRSAELPLRLTIAPTLPSYEEGDLVAISLTLANAGREPLTVLDPNKMSASHLLAGGVVSFDIRDAQGAPVMYNGAMMDYFPGDSAHAQLAPGATLTFRIVINDVRATGYYPITAPGQYRVTASYGGLATPNEATPEPNDITFNSSVKSNTITIEVVPSSTPKAANRKRLSLSLSDQTCHTDADCTDVETTCNGCACNEAVNIAHKARYVAAFHALCADFHGPQCDYYCRTPYPRCIDGRCIMTNRAPGR